MEFVKKNIENIEEDFFDEEDDIIMQPMQSIWDMPNMMPIVPMNMMPYGIGPMYTYGGGQPQCMMKNPQNIYAYNMGFPDIDDMMPLIEEEIDKLEKKEEDSQKDNGKAIIKDSNDDNEDIIEESNEDDKDIIGRKGNKKCKSKKCNEVNRVFAKIRRNNPEIIRTMIMYGVPYEVAMRLTRKIVRLSLKYR